jgi:23S rRNA (guanosine2251-2'-O)-methyltransferase
VSESESLVFGLHAVLAALREKPPRVSQVWVDRQRHDPRMHRVVEAAMDSRVACEQVPRAALERMLPGATHQGVIARVAARPAAGEGELQALLEGLEEPPFLLCLDGVTDPHNLGACLRTAEAAGVHGVLAPRDRAVGLTPVVRKVASGAAERLAFFQVVNLARTLDALRQRALWVIGAAAEAPTSLYDCDLRGPLVLVLGAEGRGLRRLTRETCDGLVSIPLQGGAESLNVAVATGICLFEARRQRAIIAAPEGGR